jgi:predicted enzyme related to lactoylglutathione lyase
MDLEPKLGVLVAGDNIIVSGPRATDPLASYYGETLPLLAKDIANRDDPDIPMTAAEFLAKAEPPTTRPATSAGCMNWTGEFSLPARVFTALEVGDIEEALAFYGRLFDFKLRGKSGPSAFIDLGDQFLALQKGRTQPADDGRHFGLVVDDKDAVRKALTDAGIQPLPGPFLDFLDPWGNRIEIVGYDNIQFSKAPNVLRGMGLGHLTKNAEAVKELTEKGMAPN